VVHHRHRFDALSLVRNDYKKSRDWARLMARSGWGLAQDHSSTHPSEAAALLCSITALAGVATLPLIPVGPALAVTGLAGLATLLRDELSVVAAEGAPTDLVTYLAVRAALYPVAATGAFVGGAGGLLERSGR